MSSTSVNEPLGARIALYSVAATGLASGVAQAAPVESEGFPISLTVETGGDSYDYQETFIDVDGDGTDDFRLWAEGRPLASPCDYGDANATASIDDSYYGDYSNYILNDEADSYYASLITDGATIDETSTVQRRYSYLTGCYYADSGNFGPPTRGYIGFSFTVGADRHYGYFDVETAQGSLVTTIHSACFESTAGVGIAAGACAPPPAAPPVDDPGAVDPDSGAAADGPQAIPVGGLIPMSLGVLALGAAAMRRRRQ
ncbi:hypothetical protein EY643_19370 [Halioglobus maricola]|uniref:PEP-CTERM sorting domain-containing protein n=1 Tax=Halioglobus maricola TaxID=2601894 RepID=A0A5P9NPA3_9GAMM|nr:hypothetical protein [Halioglobus maricola]QFU77660.1 hypothetical protein EY643_19370 [Halioglobus maricola]